MSPIKWAPEFSVGIKEIDESHRKMLTCINRLIAAQKVDTCSELISELLNDLTRYARDHFDTEERLLLEYDYPDIEKHRALHTAFRLKIVQFCSATMLAVPTVPDTLQEYLMDWWTSHILTHDMAYKEFFRKNGVI